MSGVMEKLKSRRGYHRLLSRQFSSMELGSEKKKLGPSMSRSATMKEGKGPHPVLNILEAKNKEKAMMKPEFLRYLEYMKEAGTWDPTTNSPMMYYYK